MQSLSLQRVILTKCSHLSLNLLPPLPSHLPELVITNIAWVEIWQSQSSPHLNISLNNAARVRMISEALAESYSDSAQPSAVVLSGVIITISVSVFVILLVAVIWMVLRSKLDRSCLPFRRHIQEDPDIKKVSRAESWKYQSSQTAARGAQRLRLNSYNSDPNYPRVNNFHGDQDQTYRQPEDCISDSDQYHERYDHI